MRIGLLSYHNSVNYGAVLQIYALKRTLEKLGANVSVIDYRSISSEYSSFLLSKAIKDIGLPRALAKYLYYIIFARKTIEVKKEKFTEFININFNLTRHFKSVVEFVSENDFDIVICGSDQIWNPEITNGFDKMMFCDFYNHKTQKYSYAASVGDVEIIGTKEMKKEFFKLIKNFNGITVREKELADFISQNSDINPLVTLDPTLLLNATEYRVIENVKKPVEKYVLVYQLSRYPRSIEVAQLLAREKNLKIKEIVNNPYILHKDKSMLFTESPSEFLNLVRNAEYVITNSFHGTIFSIIFKKNFYTILSRTRTSRITNLLNTLDINNRLIYENVDTFTRDSINYDKVDVILAQEREKSINYLKSIVKREGNE